ncbi:MAG: anti-sigma factor [Luteolibacter sp.]|jgi:anti-sigma-K factor RskA|nr:anti-sigma factor [Luteolibacter sp.]
MTPSDLKIRFDELCAGRALGDLTMEEELELAGLCEQLGLAPDAALDLLAAAIDAEARQESATILPAHLARRLHQWADETAEPPAAKVIIPRVPAWQAAARNPVIGWMAAAAMLVFSLWLARDKPPLPPAQAEIRLRAEAADLIERKFEGLGDFKQAAGSVIWSDQLQQGYMTLKGIPVNDPKQTQYQLWIVDPARDADSPVDGGVFDIPTDGSPVVVPIAAKLALKQPQAFVITLEQPGGVVKSKQEKVVALAKG